MENRNTHAESPSTQFQTAGRNFIGRLWPLSRVLNRRPEVAASGSSAESARRILVTPAWTVVRQGDCVLAYPAYRDGSSHAEPDLKVALESRPVVWTASSVPGKETDQGSDAAQASMGQAPSQRVEDQFCVRQTRRSGDGSTWEMPLTEWTSDRAQARRAFHDIEEGLFQAFAAESGLDGSGTGTSQGVAHSVSTATRGKARERWYFLAGGLTCLVVLALVGKAGQTSEAAAQARAGTDTSATSASAAAALAADPQLKALVEGRNLPVPKEFAALPADQQRALLEAAIASARPDPVDGSAAAVNKPLALTAVQVASLKKASALTIGTGPKTLFVFEDPHCGSCQQLAGSIEQMDRSEFTFKILPVAFLDGSMPVAVGAMCEKDPLTTWGNLLKGVPVMNPTKCAAGTSTIEANNQLFRSLGLESTPTLITPNGAVVTGNGSPEAIKRWADQQYH